MQSTEPKTNKTTPPLLPDIIHRKRLFKLLDRRQHYSISWLTGPAGSGKTTLAADYLQSARCGFIWYQLDSHDNDLSLFFSHLTRAAKQAGREVRKKMFGLDSAYLMRPLEFSRSFFENLGHYIASPFLLVFDNYHEVPPDSLFHAAFKEGLLRLPHPIHTFILSREDPPKHYSGLIANHQLRLIRNNDLAFTLDETESVIRQETGKQWPRSFMTELHEKTEGWATGLILIAKGLYALKTEPASLSDLPFDRIFDYFAVELFDRADPDVRDFLLKTALLPRIIPEIAETVTGLSRAESLLKGLFKHHYFIEQYESLPAVYQFHPLFREFLLTQAQKTLSNREIKNRQLQAAALFEARGLLNEAVALYHQADDFEKLIRLVLTHAQTMVQQSRYKTIAEWLERLPEKTIERNPWLNYWRGFGYKFEDPLKAKKYFRQAFDQFHKTRNMEGLLMSWSGAVDGINMGWNSFKEHDFYLKWFDRNIGIDYPFPSPEIEAYFLSSALMSMLMRKPQHPDLEHWMERALSLSAQSRDAFLPILIHFTAIVVLLYRQTQPDKIESLRTNLHFLAQQKDSDFFKCWDAYIEVLSFFWREDLTAEAAKELVDQAILITQKADIHFLDEYVFGVGVVSALILDNFKEAQKYLGFFENILTHLKRPEALNIYYHIKTLFHLARLEIDAALDTGYLAERTSRNSGFVFSHIRSRLGLAGVLIVAHQYDEAMDHVVRAQNQAKKFKSPILEYQAGLFKAYLFLSRGRKKQGLQRLRQALSFGKQHHFIRFVWWWNREIMTELCTLALKHGIEPDFIRQVIRSYGLRTDPAKTATENWFWPVEVETMGNFKLKVDDQYLEYRKKAKVVQLEMLKLLVALGPKPVSIEKVMAILWPDKNSEQAASAFSSTLNRLRVLLGSKEVIRVQNRRIGLDPKLCNIDIHVFERLIDQAGLSEVMNPDRFHSYEKAVQAYKGRFLENESEKSWILEKQEELKSKYLSAVLELGVWYERRNKPNQALDLYRQALVFEPADESLYRRLMNVQIRLKQKAEAVKTYLRCKKILQTVLGIPPSEEMEKMYLQLGHVTMTRNK